MKRIVLGLSLFLMLVQNGFADANIDIETIKEQGLKCEHVSENLKNPGNVQECVKAVRMLENLPDSHIYKQNFLASEAFNAGQIYFFGQKNKIKAYEYWYKAAKLGYKDAQKNLSILCKESPWACR